VIGSDEERRGAKRQKLEPSLKASAASGQGSSLLDVVVEIKRGLEDSTGGDGLEDSASGGLQDVGVNDLDGLGVKYSASGDQREGVEDKGPEARLNAKRSAR
jgi:hypothetical protein